MLCSATALDAMLRSTGRGANKRWESACNLNSGKARTECSALRKPGCFRRRMQNGWVWLLEVNTLTKWGSYKEFKHRGIHVAGQWHTICNSGNILTGLRAGICQPSPFLGGGWLGVVGLGGCRCGKRKKLSSGFQHQPFRPLPYLSSPHVSIPAG